VRRSIDFLGNERFRENFDDFAVDFRRISFSYQLAINLIVDYLSQLSKMNFSPFTTSFANVNVNQFAKFTQTHLTTPSQVSGMHQTMFLGGFSGVKQFDSSLETSSDTTSNPPPNTNALSQQYQI
jgi:hypothetical protein